jgi:hypothetical protein
MAEYTSLSAHTVKSLASHRPKKKFTTRCAGDTEPSSSYALRATADKSPFGLRRAKEEFSSEA